MELAEKIEAAFRHRPLPNALSSLPAILLDEEPDIGDFEGRRSSELTQDDIYILGRALSFFSGEAYCYYLPGNMSTGVRSNDRDSLVYDSIVFSLDRSPVVDYWDTRFLSRWPLLSNDEIAAVQDWVHWYFQSPNVQWSNTLERYHDTLELLKLCKAR